MMSTYLYQIFICVVFLLLLWGVSKIITKQRFFLQNKNNKQSIEIIERRVISRDATLVMVEVENTRLLLGVSAQGISVLKTMETGIHDQKV